MFRVVNEEPPSAGGDSTRSLRYSILDGSAHAVMQGLGEVFLLPFAIALGAGRLVVGLMASLPPFAGAVVQLGSLPVLRRIRSRKALVLRAASLQGLIWLPVSLLAMTRPRDTAGWLLALAVGYFAAGSFVGPAWNSWMGELIEPQSRGAYFARRNQWISLFQFAALVSGGLALHGLTRHGREFTGYAILFGAAFVARMVSVRFLSRMGEGSYTPPGPEQEFTFLEFLRRSPRSNFARFVFYVALVQAAANIAAPFFSVYLLRDLGFSYFQYTAAAVVVTLAQYVCLHNWGTLSDRFGNRKVLALTGLFVGAFPLLWMVSTHFYWILLCQTAAGFIWAGFNLSANNFIFDAVTPPKRARCVAYFSFLSQSGVLAGALLGGLLAGRLPTGTTIGPWTWHPVSNLYYLFVLSGLLRFLLAVIFLPRIREVRDVEGVRTMNLAYEIVLVRPIRGLFISIFHGVHPSEK